MFLTSKCCVLTGFGVRFHYCSVAAELKARRTAVWRRQSCGLPTIQNSRTGEDRGETATTFCDLIGYMIQ
jgi:hypothetical protein